MINPETIKLLDSYMNITEHADIEIEFSIEKLFTGNTMYDFVSPRNTSVVHVMLSDNVRKMKSDIIECINKLPEINQIKELTKKVKAYSVNVIVYKGWLTKKKQLKKIDLTNIWKPVEDAVMEAVGMDDSLCVEETLCKAQSDSDNAVFRVKFMLYR